MLAALRYALIYCIFWSTKFKNAPGNLAYVHFSEK